VTLEAVAYQCVLEPRNRASRPSRLIDAKFVSGMSGTATLMVDLLVPRYRRSILCIAESS